MSIGSHDYLGITITTFSYYLRYIEISTSSFNSYPTDSQINSTSWTNLYEYQVEYGYYTNYTYPILIPKGPLYLVIKFHITQDVNLLHLYVAPINIIHDIELDKIHKFRDIISSGSSAYFKMPIDNNDNLEIILETNYSRRNYFSISANFYNEEPSTSQFLNGDWNNIIPSTENETFGYDFIKFFYEIDSVEDYKYLGIRISAINLYMDFINLTITTPGIVWVFIVVGCIVFVILLVAGFFIYRKYFLLKRRNDLLSINV